MSWQDYVDGQICSVVSTRLAIIASLQDGSVWAEDKNSEIQVTPQELKTIADTMNLNPKTFQEKGILLGGEKYFCLSVDADAGIVRGRRGGSALSIVAARTCMIIVATTDGFPPGTLNTVVEAVGEHLKGYYG